MKAKSVLIIPAIIIAIALSSCSFMTTRVEKDTYTIGERDTTTLTEQKNAPGNRDNGIIYPSSRTTKSERTLLLRDSVVEREYPNFIRLGAFESVGLIGTSASHKIGTGLFGIFPDFKQLSTKYYGQSNYIFSGGIYRIGIGEWRLRWFRDAENWTYGLSLMEFLVPEAGFEKTLFSYLPVYVRKRYYLREEIPYIAVTPAFGIGWFPSQYINLSASLDIGSIGGLNLRAYAGYAAGVNPSFSPQALTYYDSTQTLSSAFPYVGLGISFLDFLNRVPETYKEWKDHEHSSWNIGLLQLTGIITGADSSYYDVPDTNRKSSSLIKGFIARFLNASVVLPVLNYQFYAGTSLANIFVAGQNEFGIGILPIRIGYWQPVILDELTMEPFIELNYYPSTFIHIGDRLNLKLTNNLNFSLVAGYASGSNTNGFGSDVLNEFGMAKSFSRAYIGISIGLMDRIFYPQELRYAKQY